MPNCPYCDSELKTNQGMYSSGPTYSCDQCMMAWPCGYIDAMPPTITEPVQSDRPEDMPNPFWPEDEWQASENVCHDCGKKTWVARWFDDSPNNGGGCIGSKYYCGSCGWRDYR